MQNNVIIEMPPFFTATRVRTCRNRDCQNKTFEEPFGCGLKVIELGSEVQCLHYMPKKGV